MRRIIAALMITVMIMTLASCGNEKTQNKNQAADKQQYEVAMIVSGDNVNDGSFNEAAWNLISSFCIDKGLTSTYYTNEKEDKESYLESVKKAVDGGAKIIIMSGSCFETAVYEAQKTYEDIYFLLIDGVPHDEKDNYDIGPNTIGMIFAEEEAGYLAGYAAVKDGYRKIGFIGETEAPAVKRYGYGFVQGAAAAADELGVKVGLEYDYTKDSDAENAGKLAAKWYKNGTEVIFTAGSGIAKSVMTAAEENNGKVIGSDVDQSAFSSSVITSAKKEIATAIENTLKDYERGSLVGGTAFNYAVKNDGVSIEIDNAKFSVFTKEDYEKVYKKLESGDIKLKKDTGVESVSELTGEWIELGK